LINHSGDDWERQVPQVHVLTATESHTISTPSDYDVAFTDTEYTIPAGTLRAGSTIRIKADGYYTDLSTAGGTLGILIDDQDNQTYEWLGIPGSGDHDFYLDAAMTIRDVGPDGTVVYSIQVVYEVLKSVTEAVELQRNVVTIDTTNNIDIAFAFSINEGSATVYLTQYIIDVT
jgi:hypothetical protein